MLRHLDVVAHALRFYGALVGAIFSVMALLVGTLAVATGEPALLIAAPLMMGFGALFSVPFIVTGRGLLQGRPWARIAGIVLSMLIITDLPIGMSLGILGLGVLLDEEVAHAFSEGSTRRVSMRDRVTRAQLAASSKKLLTVGS